MKVRAVDLRQGDEFLNEATGLGWEVVEDPCADGPDTVEFRALIRPEMQHVRLCFPAQAVVDVKRLEQSPL